MVMNLLDLMDLLREKVLSEVDHKDLNHDVEFLRGRIPTAENLAIGIWDRIAPEFARFEGCQLRKIRLFESRDNWVEYRGEPSTACWRIGPTRVKTLPELWNLINRCRWLS